MSFAEKLKKKLESEGKPVHEKEELEKYRLKTTINKFEELHPDIKICQICGTPLKMDISTLDTPDWYCPKCNPPESKILIDNETKTITFPEPIPFTPSQKRIKEILSVKKDSTTNRKTHTDKYIQRKILDAFEYVFAQMNIKVKIDKED